MKKNINHAGDYWLIQHQILQKDIIGIVWRITNEVLGVKGLTKLALFSWGEKNQISGNPLNDLLVFGSNGNIFQFKVIRVNPPFLKSMVG